MRATRQHLAERRARKRKTPDGHFVEHQSEREQIRSAARFHAVHLLRSHVGGGAHDGVGLGYARGRKHLRKTEVQDLHAMARDHDVGRLEVAMDDPERVRLGQCGSDLRAVVRYNLGGERPFL
jgi:hypothetical protein